MSATETKEWLRPSMLPKLAQCGHYRPESDAGEAAERGTKMDELFRGRVSNTGVQMMALSDDEDEAINWAVDTARALAGGLHIEAREDLLRIECLGMTGTADALCEDAQWSADLKSGQLRGYAEQQAAYALGFMDRLFVDEWTVYLLFCDQREVVTLRFTREEAEKLIRGVLAKANDPELPPTVNDYCGWCAMRWTCPARREAIGITPFNDPTTAQLEALPSWALRDFVLRAKTVEDFAEKAREILKVRTVEGEKTPGVSIANRTGSRVLAAQYIEPFWKQIGTAKICALLGNVSEAKAKPLFDGSGVEFPDDKVKQLPGSSFVRVSRPKGDK